MFWGLLSVVLMIFPAVLPFGVVRSMHLTLSIRLWAAYQALLTVPLLVLITEFFPWDLWMFGVVYFTITGCLLAFYMQKFQHYPSRNTVYLVVETNVRETLEFMSHFIRGPIMILSVIVFAVWLVSAWWAHHLSYETDLFLAEIFSILLMIPMLHPKVRCRILQKPQYVYNGIDAWWKESFQNLIQLIPVALFQYYQERKKMNELIHLLPEKIGSISFDENSPSLHHEPVPEVHVVIVGESCVRSHMQLYGYFRPTTPKLESIKDEMILFDETISSHSGTIASIRDLFTFCDAEHFDDYFSDGTLIQFLRKAGYHTWWLSNQCPTGWNETFATALAHSCDDHFFVNHSDHYSRTSYDEKLLLPLDSALQHEAQKKIIFLHLMGQHFDFQNRYPTAFKQFRETDDLQGIRGIHEQINDYDNAVLYHDSFVYQVIEKVREKDCLATVLTLSDHGIDLFEYSDSASQTEWDGSRPMFEIPFFLWGSEQYRERYQDLWKQLCHWKHRKAITSDFIHSYPTLLGFSMEPQQALKNFFSSTWEFHARIIVDSERQIDRRDFDEQIAVISDVSDFRRDLLQRQDHRFKEIVWAHCCNSIQKMQEATDIFSGAELDLVWDDQGFYDVTHPPTPSIGLTLNRILEVIPQNKGFNLWLDLKNLSLATIDAQGKAILAACQQAEIDLNHVIVESPEFDCVCALENMGLRASYYIPTPILRELKKQNFEIRSEAQDQEVKLICDRCSSLATTHISLDGLCLEFLTHFLPQRKRVLTWLEHQNVYDYHRRQEVTGVLNSYSQLEVVLVKHPSQYDR